jgi:hypothetical protein
VEARKESPCCFRRRRRKLVTNCLVALRGGIGCPNLFKLFNDLQDLTGKGRNAHGHQNGATLPSKGKGSYAVSPAASQFFLFKKGVDSLNHGQELLGICFFLSQSTELLPLADSSTKRVGARQARFLIVEAEPEEGLSTRKLLIETAKRSVLSAYSGEEANRHLSFSGGGRYCVRPRRE